MTEESTTKVSNRSRYLQRFGAAALGAFVGGFLVWLVVSGLEISIQEYVGLLINVVADRAVFVWSPIILAVAIGMFVKRPIIGFVLALLISGIITFAIVLFLTAVFG